MLKIISFTSSMLLLGSSLSFGAEYHVHNKITSAQFTANTISQPARGVMNRMTGKLVFEENNFSAFKALIHIDVNSIFTTTQSSFPGCLDRQKHPHMILELTSATAVDSKHFVANGTLQINGVKKPLELNFTFDQIYTHIPPGDQTELDLYARSIKPIVLLDFGVSCGEVSSLQIDQLSLYGLLN